MFRLYKEAIIDATLGLVEQERDGEAIDGGTIKTMAESFGKLLRERER